MVAFADEYTRQYYEVVDSETTCALIKPDAYERMGDIIEIVQSSLQLRITRLRMFKLSKAQAVQFVSEHQADKDFDDLTDFMSSDAIVVMVLCGRDAVKVWRDAVGPLNSAQAKIEAPTSIRALYGTDAIRNAVHGSESTERAAWEMGFFFTALELVQSTTAILNNCSLCIIKPHVVHSAAGKIIAQILENGLEISAMELLDLSFPIVEEFMEAYRRVLPEFADICAQIASGQCLVMEIRQEGVVEKLRALVGPLDPELGKKIRPQSMRAKYGIDRVRNAVHCTDLVEDGQLECEYFFSLLKQR